MKIDFERYKIEGDFKFELGSLKYNSENNTGLKDITFGIPVESPADGNFDKEKIAELVSEKLKQDFKKVYLGNVSKK